MPWVEIFAVFIVCHLVGDYLLQTEWQARHKRGGLGGDRVAARALVSHVAAYGVAFVPAFVWLWDSLGAGVLGIALLILLPHLIQDDGRLLVWYARVAKGADLDRDPALWSAVDQSFHVLALFLVALLAGS
jgi:hypothetical protein